MLLIESIRKHASAWYTKVFLGVLALCFVVLWGGGDMLQRGFFGHGQTVVTVGSETIGMQEFAEELHHTLRRIQLQTQQQISMEEAKKLGLYGQILQGVIQKTLLNLECDRLGLRVTDDTIRSVTHGNTLFQDESGIFQKDRFDYFLKALGISQAGYVENMRGDLRRAQLITALTGGIKVPEIIFDRLYKWQNEKRQVKVVSVPAASVKDTPEPTDDELEKLWETNPGNAFTVPEYRRFTAIVFGPQQATVSISPEKIQEAYDSRKDSDYKGKSLMQVSQEIKSELEQQAKGKALEELRAKVEDMEASGATLKEISDKYKLDLVVWSEVDSTGASKDSKKKEPQHKLKDLMLQVAFQTDADESSDSVEATTGDYIMVHVDKIIPSQKMSFKESKTQVKAKWVEARRLLQAEDVAKELADKINKEGEKAIKGYKVQTVTLERQATDASKKAGVPANFIGRAFVLDKDHKATSFASAGEPGSLVLILEKVIPSSTKHTKETDEFKERIRSMFVNDILERYLSTLEQRYRVDVNKKALEAF